MLDFRLAAAPDASGDSITYYVCPIYGYHNWTATDSGYRCDHCGNLVTDKQLAGYPNVNGVYEPKTTTTAVPQTGDESAPALWLGLLIVSGLTLGGITLHRRKKTR